MAKVLKNNLRVLMAQKGIRSMVELERLSGVSRQVLDRLDKNKSTRLDFATVVTLCDLLDCEPGDLLYIDENREGD